MPRKESDHSTGVPQHTLEALLRYRDQRIPTGGFLYAVLTNDLRDALGRADNFNRSALYEIVHWCYWELPAPSWGSKEKVAAWLEQHDTQETLDD